MAGRILVLEDDPDQSVLMCDVLMGDGHDCLTAGSVDEAEHILDGERIDLAILDMNLPGRSGLEALKHIRSSPATEQVPVIVLTANHQFQRQAEQMGTDLFLVKPLNLSELRTLVMRYLNH